MTSKYQFTTLGKLHHVRFRFDNETESGYYGDGKVRYFDPASKTLQAQYKNVGEYLDDDRLEKAIKKVGPEWHNSEYVLMGRQHHNCQDYIDAVLEEYYRLKKQEEKNDPCK